MTVHPAVYKPVWVDGGTATTRHDHVDPAILPDLLEGIFDPRQVGKNDTQPARRTRDDRDQHAPLTGLTIHTASPRPTSTGTSSSSGRRPSRATT